MITIIWFNIFDMHKEGISPTASGMDEASGVRKEDEKPDVREDLKGALKTVLWEKQGYRAKQLEVLERLPDDFLEQMRGHLMDVDKEQRNPITDRESVLRVLKGELFEQLIYAQMLYISEVGAEEGEPLQSIRLESLQGDEKTVAKNRALAGEALALFHDSERYNISGSRKNPDLALIDIKTGTVVGVVEAKTAEFDQRAYQQASEFKGSMEYTLSQVRESYDAIDAPTEEARYAEFFRQYGLSRDILDLKVAPKLQRIFVVPADRKIDTRSDRAALVAYKNKDGAYVFDNPQDRIDFQTQLRNGDILVDQSYFNTNEIDAMSRELLKQIEQRWN
jgi:hypothetical protein